MRFGAAWADLTPPAGTRFGGFWRERPAPATGAHDPLLASALVAEGDDGVVVALVSTDLQLISRNAVNEARRRLADRLALPAAAVLVHATHNHAAPGGDWAEAFIEAAGDYFAPPAVEERVVEAIVASVGSAFERRTTARMWCAASDISGIGRFRHDGSAPRRAPAMLLWADAPDGTKAFVAAFYGCHVSVLGPENRLFSADFAGIVRADLGAWAQGAPALYVNTPAADVSTRTTRRGQDFAEVERLGHALAAELIGLAPLARELTGSAVGGREGHVALPLRPSDGSQPPSEARQRAARLGTAVDCRLQWLDLGPLALVGVEAEVGFDLGVAVRQASGRDLVSIVAPAGGSVGNLPSHLFAPEAAQALVAAVGRMAAGGR